MRRITRLVWLVASLMSLFAVLSSTAGAVTWHNTGDTAFTATNTTASTLTVTGVNLTCTGADATGTSPSGSVGAATYVGASGTLVFTGCLISGIPLTIHCNYSFTTSSAGTAGGIFDGTADTLCSATQFGSEICKIEGQTPSSYTNPEGGLTGRLTLAHSSTLRTTNGTGGSCPLGANEGTTLTTQVFNVRSATGGSMTPHGGPTVVRTA